MNFWFMCASEVVTLVTCIGVECCTFGNFLRGTLFHCLTAVSMIWLSSLEETAWPLMDACIDFSRRSFFIRLHNLVLTFLMRSLLSPAKHLKLALLCTLKHGIDLSVRFLHSNEALQHLFSWSCRCCWCLKLIFRLPLYQLKFKVVSLSLRLLLIGLCYIQCNGLPEFQLRLIHNL